MLEAQLSEDSVLCETFGETSCRPTAPQSLPDILNFLLGLAPHIPSSTPPQIEPVFDPCHCLSIVEQNWAVLEGPFLNSWPTESMNIIKCVGFGLFWPSKLCYLLFSNGNSIHHTFSQGQAVITTGTPRANYGNTQGAHRIKLSRSADILCHCEEAHNERGWWFIYSSFIGRRWQGQSDTDLAWNGVPLSATPGFSWGDGDIQTNNTNLWNSRAFPGHSF